MILFSLLDRLMTESPETDAEPAERLSGDAFERELESAVQVYGATVERDLEWLLNTRRTAPAPSSLTGAPPDEVERSVFCYGLPSFDFVTLSPGANRCDTNRLAEEILKVVRCFEPRILDPKVVVEQTPSCNRPVRFSITGRLNVQPGPRFVRYNTLLDVISGRYRVELMESGRG
jgi:type VI secretion system lysozyme-like protein